MEHFKKLRLKNISW